MSGKFEIEESDEQKGTARTMNALAMTNNHYLKAALAALMALVLAASLLARIAGPAEAAFPGQNGKIVFASNRTTLVTNPTGDNEIYTMNADGTGLKQLTFNKSDDNNPAFSPSGRRIVFDGNRDGNFEIYTMKADGSDQKRLTHNDALDYVPAYSPDGSKIAFESVRDGNDEVYTMDSDGTDQKNVSKNSASVDGNPAWSPDGERIAFQSNRYEHDNIDIYTMKSADGTGLDRVTHDEAVDSTPNWSPDGHASQTSPRALPSIAGGGHLPLSGKVLFHDEVSGGTCERPLLFGRRPLRDAHR